MSKLGFRLAFSNYDLPAREPGADHMQIAYHIGANCTDEERLLKSVLRNASALLEQDIVVPGPSKYRRLLRETIQGLDGAPPKPGTRDILLDAIIEEDNVRRLVMSNDNFIAIPKRIFDHGIFYPQVEGKARGLARLFPEDEISFFIGLRHPASFLQEVARRSEVPRLRDFLGTLSPLEMRWSNVIERIRKVAPRARVYAWCNEDTPIIWEDLIRLLSGADESVSLEGGLDLVGRIITRDGLAKLRQTLQSIPASDRVSRHEAIANAIENYGKPDTMEDEVIFPEMGTRLIDAMGQIYDKDVEILAQMEGVTLILPFQ